MSAFAEKNLLGYLLMDSSKMNEVANKVVPEMFTDPLYGSIYNEFYNGFNENEEVSLVTIQTALLDKYGDTTENLKNLITNLDISSSVKSCIDSITDTYRLNQYKKSINQGLSKEVSTSEAIRQMISTLEGLITDDGSEMVSVSEIVKNHKDEYFNPKAEKKKIFFGLKEIDRLVGGVEGGDVVVLAARPAVGKSALSLQIIEHNANQGKKVGYFNLEMQENQVYERMAAKASGIEMARIRNATRFLNDEEHKFTEGNEKLSQWNNVFVRSGSATVSDLRMAVKNGHYDLVVVDYLQLLKPNKSRGANRYAEVGDISRGVKAIAMDCDVPIIALSQLNRASEGKEDKEPTMSELRESGDIEQDASVIIMLWNSDKNDKTKKKVKVDKARQGKLGVEELIFNGATMTFMSADKFENISDEDNPFL